MTYFFESQDIYSSNSMTTEPRNPFADLAIPEFRRQFGDLLSVRASFGDLECGLIIGVMSNMMLSRYDGDSAKWEQIARAAHHFLDHGALKRTRESCEAFIKI